ncbi:tropomyosin-like [Dorcoceras hygrometricum]|uniref:Tropomyosin-like n=1 Tax=Dorcoceras hygrometricum TaxID=472368 RepID=A0A2Z7CWL0_9LAMI|nr:tropomyosin-like [Dorcoceras hygrometricum]
MFQRFRLLFTVFSDFTPDQISLFSVPDFTLHSDQTLLSIFSRLRSFATSNLSLFLLLLTASDQISPINTEPDFLFVTFRLFFFSLAFQISVFFIDFSYLYSRSDLFFASCNRYTFLQISLLVPIQMIEPIPAAPAVAETFEQPTTEDEIPADQPADEVTGDTVIKAVAADVDATAENVAEQVADPSADVETSVEEFTEPAVEVTAKGTGPTSTDDVDIIIKQVIADTAQMGPTEDEVVDGVENVSSSAVASQPAVTVEERQWFDLPYEDLIARWDTKRIVTTPSDTDEEIETERAVVTADGVQTESSQPEYIVEEPEDMEMSDSEKSVDEQIDEDELMSLEDIILSIPVDVPLPSAGVEITKITMGNKIKIPGIDERTCYLASLPQIPVDDKGKEILVEKDPVKGNPAKEHYSLIWADIDPINVEEMSKKEAQVQCWGDTETTRVALKIKMYILLKYREVLVRKFLDSWKKNFVPGEGSSATDLNVIDMLSTLHLFVLEELKKQTLAHGLRDRTCCSKIFEGHPRDRGAVIARTNTNTPSKCWIRTMIRVDGVWVVEPFCDQWVKIPRPVVCNEVSRQCSYVDHLPVLSEPLRILRKRWAYICIEAANFFVSGGLIPVGSINFCRSLSVVEPVYDFAPRQPTVLALRISQFCTVYIQYSLFSRLPTEDITSFVASIASERTVLKSVQTAQNSVSVAPRVQLIDEHYSSESSSDDTLVDFLVYIQYSLFSRLPTEDITSFVASIASERTVLKSVQTMSKMFAQLRASVELIQFEKLEHNYDVKKIRETLSLHINDLERKISDRFDAHDRTYRVLFNNVRHDMRDHKNLLSLDLKSYQQKVSTQVGAAALNVVDVRREVKEMNAKVDVVSSRLDDVKKDVEATKEAISHQLLEFQIQAQANYIILTDQLGQLVDYINRGGNDKNGEGSSRGPQPPPAVQIRDSSNACGSGDAVRTTEITQRDIDTAQRDILERMMTVDRERERSRGSRSGSYKRIRY